MLTRGGHIMSIAIVIAGIAYMAVRSL